MLETVPKDRALFEVASALGASGFSVERWIDAGTSHSDEAPGGHLGAARSADLRQGSLARIATVNASKASVGSDETKGVR